MFINPAVFKKLIKDSWSKEGLTIGATEEEIFFAGAFWVIRMYKEEMPKKIKAAAIELIGDFPGTGEVFTCHKKKRNPIRNSRKRILEHNRKLCKGTNPPECYKNTICRHMGRYQAASRGDNK